MDRRKALQQDPELLELFDAFKNLYTKLGACFLNDLKRLPSLPDVFIDRWQRAEMLGFGKGTSIYDSSLVIGEVAVGQECWIGPNTILDGSGGLAIGDFCTISAGVHIYTHDNVRQTLSSKRLPIDRKPTAIGQNVYIAPNVVITKGVQIGNHSVVAVGSYVNKSFPPNSILMGQPAKVVGHIKIGYDTIDFIYD